MTFTTPNGIRRPDDPSAYADIIQFFKDMAEDVDEKFVPKANDQVMTGTLTSKTFISSNGGSTQSSTVLQTGPTAASAFAIYDDNVRLDGTAGRRLWVAGANNTDVKISTRSGSETLNQISMRAAKIDLTGAVTITGTLNITAMKTVKANYEGDVNLAASQDTWKLLYAATTGFTFVAPPSQSVLITYSAFLPADEYGTMLSYEIKTGATIGSGTTVLLVKPAAYPNNQPPPHGIAINGTASGGTQWASVSNTYVVNTGLVAGTTYNVRPYYRNFNPKVLKLYRHGFVIQPDL